MSTMLEAAKSWIANGFSVIPLSWRSKRPAFDALKASDCVDADGRPIWEMFKERQASEWELRTWFGGPRRNLGVVTGWNGLVVIDFDSLDAYQAWQSWAKIAGGRAAEIAASTYRVASARGMHVYLLVEGPVTSYRIGAIDVKAQWGYVLVPPSVHPSGYVYQSHGTTIMRIKRLSDIFPFAPHPIEGPALPEIARDPWEAASRAVVCSGESLQIAKRLLRLTDLVRVVREDRGGSWALCPLHHDTQPSLRLYRDGHFHCFGCGAHGDVIDLYAALRHLTIREAIARLVFAVRSGGVEGQVDNA